MSIRVLLSAALLLAFSAFSVPSYAQPPAHSASTSEKAKRPTSKSRKKVTKKSKARVRRPKRVSRVRLHRIQRAFVASEDLKPMARQLLDSRSRAAYAGVERYAARHAHDDAGALANLALGYAHILDHDPDAAILALQRAQARAGEVRDYVTYFLADAYQAAGKNDQAAALLKDFDARYADSLFDRQAAIVYANALIAGGDPQRAIAILDKHRLPTRADVELALGQAELKAGQTDKGADTLRHLYFSMPAAPEADRAGALLASTPQGAGATYALQKTRADALARARQYRDAATAYRDLLPLTAPDDMSSVQVSLGGALHKAGDDGGARKLLQNVKASGETEGERLFYLMEIARSDNDNGALQQWLDQLRGEGPQSSWLEQGLLLMGNVYLLQNDYDHAIDCYREIRVRFPKGRLAAYANWKDAWLSLRQNRIDDARQGFDRQISDYPDSQQAVAAIYWRARLAEQNEHDPVQARAYYAALANRFPNYYYADLARVRLGESPKTGAATADKVLLESLPRPRSARLNAVLDPPEDDLHLEKARLLHNAGLTDFAVRELKAAAAEGGSAWAVPEMARLYRDDGQFHRAVELLKSTVPQYFSMDLDDLPRAYWEDLFPRPYWSDLQRTAKNNGLDPYLVASLIRQESEFNPGAVSRANALGLMQVMPATGKKLARVEKIRRFRTESLLVPETNLRLGTRYFRDMVDHYNGNVAYALAAYNAGTDRVDAWLANGKFQDTAEFVESIPFTETREYVQAIMRNASVYRKLYAGASEKAALRANP